ncbi:MAG: hypothetical protein FWD40_09170 [Treponema sp.]|nr:hypothetical protein [Treponema sp.]
MLFEEISVERLGAIRYKEGREDGREEGKAEGREEVFELMAQGLSVEEIKNRLTQAESSDTNST